MMKKKIVFGLVLAVTIALLFAGCSSGGGSAVVSGGGGVKTTSKGVITGFGSVIVNGVEYDSSGAAVAIDDASGDVSGLKIGMEVTIKSNGTVASSIVAADDLEGPIDSVDIAMHLLVVLGQTVQIDNLTLFENTIGLTALGVGDIVEANGFTDSLGVLHATRVELKTAVPTVSTSIEIKGIVSNLTSTNFTMNSLIVGYATAILNDFPAGGLANGQFVEVKSTLGQYNPADVTLPANVVEFKPGLEAAEGEHVEVEGYVTDFVSIADFKVDGVSINASTAGATGIANDIKVEVEGTINASGVLAASKVEVEQESDLVLEGDVIAIDAAAGVVTLLSTTANLTSTTGLKDSSAAQLQYFNATDITVGDHLEISGFMAPGGTFIATKVERLEPSTQAVLAGPATSKIANTSLVVLGITVTVDSNTKYKDKSGSLMIAADFFFAVTVNTTVVKAQWDTFSSLTAPVDELELE